MHIVCMTISGFPQHDDCSFRFAGLNVFRADAAFVCEALRWFLYCRESHEFRTTETFSELSFLELRIRSDDGQDFRELRGKRRQQSDANLICVRREMSRPHTVLVDDDNRIRFEQFHYEMKQLKLCFGTTSFSPLNVIGRKEVKHWITPARKLWSIVYESLKVAAFARHESQDQDFKSVLRRKLNSGMLFDYQEKMDELKGRIDGSRMYRKLQATLDAMAGGVMKKELRIYEKVLKIYETKLKESVVEGEQLEEKRALLTKQLDEEFSIVPNVQELLVEDIGNYLAGARCSLAWMETEQQTVNLVQKLYSSIEKLLSLLQGSINGLLELSNNILKLRRTTVLTECEIELNENGLHFLSLTEGEKYQEMRNCQDSLRTLIGTAQEIMETAEKSADTVGIRLQECKELLNVTEKSNEQAAQMLEGETLINALAETSQKLIKTKLSIVTIYKNMWTNESLISENLHKIDCLSLDSIRGLAEIQIFLQSTSDEALKSNFIGFACEHLKFTDPAVSTLALPHLTEIMPLAIFRNQAKMLEMMPHLPSKHSYHLFAMDTISNSKSQPAVEIPRHLRPLTELLVKGPLDSVLGHFLKDFYFTEQVPEQVNLETLQNATIICIKEDLVIGDGGVLAGGGYRADTIETLICSVQLAVEGINIERKLRAQQAAAEHYQLRMECILDKLVDFSEDSFDRFFTINQSSANWSEIPLLLAQLNDQRLLKERKEIQLKCWTSMLEQLESGQLQERAYYDQRINDQKKLLETSLREWQCQETDRNEMLTELKLDLFLLRELLIHAETFRNFTVPLELHQQLLTCWEEFENELQETLTKLDKESAERPNIDVLDQLDQLEQEAIGTKRKLFEYNDRLQQSDQFYQELRAQHKSRVMNLKRIKIAKGAEDFQRLYESKKKLEESQPAYKKSELERFKFKLELLREDERLATSYRTAHFSNFILPCVEKLAAVKLRLITQMMAGIPAYLVEPGTIRLNLLYDQEKCLPIEDGDPKMNTFSTQNTVGLSVDFVDEEQKVLSLVDQNDLYLAHFMFFVCFLSVEGCKVLLLQDSLTGLSQEDQEDVLLLLEVFSQNMQIFVTAGSFE